VEAAARPTAGESAATGVINAKVYVGGRATPSAIVGSNEIYNPITKDAWTTLMPAKQAVINASPAVANSRLYCFGGANDGRLFVGSIYNNVQIYQP
jgi:hypothetical protein